MPQIMYAAKDGRDEGGREQQQREQGQENEGNATITRSIPGASKSDNTATSSHAVNIDPRTLRSCPYLHTMKASDLQLENVKVLLREFDCAPVVQKTKATVSKTDILKPGDVLILLNDKFLFGLQGGISAVEDLLRKPHDDSDSNEIVLYRPPNRAGAQCSYIDPTTNHRCGNGNTKRGSCKSVLCSTHNCPRADGQRFNESCPTPGGELTCNVFIGSSGETCPNPAVRDGKCPDHAARVKCNAIDLSTGKACTNPARSDGKCFSHGGKDFCSAIIDASTKAKCTNIAVRDGKCHAHGGKDTCDFVDAITKVKCGNIAVRGGKCCSHGGRDTCDFVIDASTKAKCGNIAVSGGKCFSHGDCNRCTYLDCSGKQCIRERVEGVGTMCLSCSNRNAECQSSGCGAIAFFGGLCEAHNVNSPSTILLEHMDKRMKQLKSLMTEEQYKVVPKLHALRKMLMHNNMQDTSTSVNDIIANLCNDMVKMHLTDKKYQGQSVIDDTLKNWLSLELYVHRRSMWSLKCAVRDLSCEHNYGERLSAEKARQILEAIDSALENFVKEHGFLPLAKLGSGNVDERWRDNNLYNSAIFDRDKKVVLVVDITNNERALAERFGIGYLAGLGISVNCQLVGSEIPATSNQDDQRIGLYMMFSLFQSTSVHFAESGILHRGVRLPPGATMILSSESPPPISEQLNDNQTQDSGDELDDSGAFSPDFGDENEGDCGGVDDDDSKTCAESTETDGNEDDSPDNTGRTLRRSSRRKAAVAPTEKDTSKKFKSSHVAEMIEDANAPKSSKETAASSDDNDAKMKYSDNIDEDDEKGGVVKLTNEIGVQACDSQFKTPDAKRFQPSTTPSGLSFDSSDYTAGELDWNAKNVMDEQRFGVKNSAFASISSLQNSCGKVVTPNPSPADDLFKSVNAGTSSESTAPHGVLPAGVHHPGMAQWQGGFPYPYQSMTAAMHPGAAVEGMAQWLGGYPVQPMAAGPVPPSHMAKQMGLVVAQTEWIREQSLASRKSRITDDLARRITSALFAKHKSDPERFSQILKSGMIEVLAGSEVTNYEDPRTDLSELVKTLEQLVGGRKKE